MMRSHLFLTLLIVLATLYAANTIMFHNVSALLIDEPVDVVILYDETCAECFSPQEYLGVLARIGIAVGDVDMYDIASGRGGKLSAEYQVAKVPALILAPEAAGYAWFESSWSEVGTKEEDGWYVLRNVEKVHPDFKELLITK